MRENLQPWYLGEFMHPDNRVHPELNDAWDGRIYEEITRWEVVDLTALAKRTPLFAKAIATMIVTHHNLWLKGQQKSG